MKVRDLIAKLQEMDQDLPVCTVEPNHGWGSEYMASRVEVVEDKYEAFDAETSKQSWQTGRHVLIS